MEKQKILDEMEKAKRVHLNVMDKIATLVEGKEVELPTSLSKMECQYGSWLYPNQEVLMQILGAQLFHRLDNAHEAWHHDYANIYNIFSKEEKKTGFFSKFLGNNKVDTMTLDKAKFYYSELQSDTTTLLHETDVAIKRANALSSSKFN